jgi:hypothetical protein
MKRLPSFKKLKTSSFLIIILFSLSFSSLSSCLKNSEHNNQISSSALTVINAAPDAPAFDFVLNRELVLPANISFAKSTKYFSLFPGTYNARFYRNKTFVNPLYTTNINLARGKYHSLFLVGTVADSLSSLLIEDNLTKPKAGNAKVRFVNLSPNVGGLDFSIVDDSLFASKKEFKQYTNFHEIPTGEYNAKFKTSTDAFMEQNHTFKLKLEEGKIYTVWAKGLVETTDEDQKFQNGLIIHNLF